MKRKILIMIVQVDSFLKTWILPKIILQDRSFLYLDSNGSVAKISLSNQLINDVSLDNDVPYITNICATGMSIELR